MLRTSGLLKAFAVLVIFVVAGIAVSSFMSGCATTGTTDTTMGDEVAAAQRAKEDSLAKAKYEREFLIAVSTGNEHHKNRNYQDAIKPLKKAAAMDTSGRFPSVYRQLADSYIKLDQPDSALAVYRQGLARYPDNAFFYRSLGWLLTAKQEIPEAIDAYMNAIKYDGETVSDYQNVGPLLISQDRLEEALEVYREWAAMEPQNAQVQETIATLMSSVGMDTMEIIKQKEVALENNPEDSALMFELGRDYFRERMYPEAIEKFNMLLEKVPDDAEALEYKGSALQNEGEFRDAITAYEKVLALRPENVKVMCEMATCYRELGNHRKAMSVVQDAIRTDPDFGLAHIVKGEIYEAVADACVGQREKRVTNIHDKLVYEKAYNSYQRAMQDPQYSDRARARMNYIKPETPTTEDRFLHPDVKEPQLDCYTWLP